MSGQPNLVLLVGSAKQHGRSTSESLGGYLSDRLVDLGWASQMVYVHYALRTEARTQAMLEAVDAADLVILAAPLYVDSLPYLVTDTLERIAAHRTEAATDFERLPRFVSVINCGFPEAQHNDVALAICRQFAEVAGLEWAGGLRMGGGGFVHGIPLAEHGQRAEGIRRAIDQAAAALGAGKPVPQESVDLLAKPVVPAWLYTSIGNLNWHRNTRKRGVHDRLYDRPFAR